MGMTPLRSTTLALLAAVAVVTSACSTVDPGHATPDPTGGIGSGTTPSTPSAAPSGPQLDITKFKTTPCDLLSTAQISTLGEFDAPRPDAKPLGPSCAWYAKDVVRGASYTVSLVTNGSTVESMAESAKSSPVFKETKVDGRTAISYDITNGQGDCTTAVSTSSKDAIVVQINTLNEASPEHKDSCGASEKVAALVIQNLKG